jgi:pimeloyl-ACP methyl ester carboxylesterase
MRIISFGLSILLAIAASIQSARAQVTISHISAAECGADCQRTAVIFLHGLTGSQETWLNTTSQQSFPALLAQDPDLIDLVDVYSVQYDSLWNSGQPIVKVTDAVAIELDALMRTKRFARVVLVGHSLGGNIAREYLAHVKARFGHAALGRFPLLITLGTPLDGASMAGFLSLFSSNEQIRSLLEIRKNDFLQLLRQTEEGYLAKQINNQCTPLELDAAFETERVGPVMIVAKESATSGATRSAGDGWAKSHTSLPKPADRADPVYAWVKSEVGLCQSQTGRCLAATSPTAVCSTGDF